MYVVYMVYDVYGNFKWKMKILKFSGPFSRVNHSLRSLPEVFWAWRHTYACSHTHPLKYGWIYQ